MLDELEEMKEAFDMFDLENSGRIAPREIGATLQTLGLEGKNAAVRAIMSDLDKLEGRPIDFGEVVF